MRLLGKATFLNKTLYLRMWLLQIVTFLNEVNLKKCHRVLNVSDRKNVLKKGSCFYILDKFFSELGDLSLRNDKETNFIGSSI